MTTSVGADRYHQELRKPVGADQTASKLATSWAAATTVFVAIAPTDTFEGSLDSTKEKMLDYNLQRVASAQIAKMARFVAVGKSSHTSMTLQRSVSFNAIKCLSLPPECSHNAAWSGCKSSLAI